jgi:hypothetical protein
MLKNLQETDFYKLNEVAIARLNPGGISAFLIVSFIFNGIITLVIAHSVTYAMSTHTITNPVWNIFLKILISFLMFHLLAAIFFGSMKNAYKFQKVQAVLLIIAGVIMSIVIYPFYFLICDDRDAPSFMFDIGMYMFLGGLVCLGIFTFRGFRRIKQGEFRQGGQGLYNFKNPKIFAWFSVMFVAILLLIRILFIFYHFPYDTGRMIGLSFALFFTVFLQYVMALALPEFIILTYCKFRFTSFNVKMSKGMLDKQRR